jgi:hypothetical protein
LPNGYYPFVHIYCPVRSIQGLNLKVIISPICQNLVYGSCPPFFRCRA